MLEWATDYFEEKKINTPRLSIEWLLSHVLNCNRLDLYLAYDRPLTAEDLQTLKPLILKRAKHEPLQYITGSSNFFGLEFRVNPSVLIPRPETEQLVELILTDYPSSKSLNVLDIGTGSGCIPVTLKKERPGWNVYATDISEDALEVAQKNAEANGVDVTFNKHDLATGINPFPDMRFDIIVSNPPYIYPYESESIDTEVREFEPELALFHPDVLSVYENILKIASTNLNLDGKLYLEINEKLGAETLKLFSKTGRNSELKSDYSGKDRFVVSNFKST